MDDRGKMRDGVKDTMCLALPSACTNGTPTVLGLRGKVLVAGGYRGGFCEKLLEASSMSDRANAIWLQDGPATGQGSTLWKGAMLEQFVKNCSPWEGFTLEKFMEDCLLWEGPHAGAGEKCEESSP